MLTIPLMTILMAVNPVVCYHVDERGNWVNPYACAAPEMTAQLNQILEQKLTPADVVVTYSPGDQIGKTTYAWDVGVCNHSYDATATVDLGMVREEAVIIGHLPVKSDSEAKIDMTSNRNKSFPVRAGGIGHEIAEDLAIVGAAGLFSIDKTGIAALLLSNKLLNRGVNYLQGQAPPAFSDRFPDGVLLRGQILLAPRTCSGDRVMFTRKSRAAHSFSTKLN